MSFREKIEQIPLIKHKFLYLCMILLFLLLLRTPILGWTGIGEQGITLFHCVFLLFSVTIGLHEFRPYYNKSTGVFRVIIMAMTIFLWSFLVENFIGALLSSHDPQQLEQYTFQLSWPYVFNHFGRYSLVGIGEEIFKWMVFLVFYNLCYQVGKNSILSFLISVIVTCLLFGYLHINYNLDQALNILLIIGSSAIVYFYFLIKYQTIIPLMIAHGLNDFLVSLEMTSELEGIFILSVYVMFLFVVGIPVIKNGWKMIQYYFYKVTTK